MKKLAMFLLAFSFAIVLAACNQTAEDVSKEGNESSQEEQNNQEQTEGSEGTEEDVEEETEKELTLEEVFEKTMESSNTLTSFAMTSDVDMAMSSNLQEGPLNMKTTIEGQVVAEPLAMYQQMSTSMAGTAESFATEMYVTEEGFFFLEPSNNTWLKMPSEMSAQLLGEAATQQTNPAAELANLQKFVSDFQFQKDETNYILKLKADGEKFADFAQDMLANSMPQEFASMGNIFENTAIENLEYEMYIDQETFYPTALNMNIKMAITEGEETLTMDMKMTGTYSEFNNVSVTVPQDIIDSAQEISAETGM
ncbi:hypothetical protein GCM10008967_23880 [Bacillus carboniphilus]|uniref:Lipoprotein n=1 Tax=Bacillus carboniphilus TaxID=86663 RepID=A0ABP3G447_9BACI